MIWKCYTKSIIQNFIYFFMHEFGQLKPGSYTAIGMRARRINLSGVCNEWDRVWVHLLIIYSWYLVGSQHFSWRQDKRNVLIHKFMWVYLLILERVAQGWGFCPAEVLILNLQFASGTSITINRLLLWLKILDILVLRIKFTRIIENISLSSFSSPWVIPFPSSWSAWIHNLVFIHFCQI